MDSNSTTSRNLSRRRRCSSSTGKRRRKTWANIVPFRLISSNNRKRKKNLSNKSNKCKMKISKATSRLCKTLKTRNDNI